MAVDYCDVNRFSFCVVNPGMHGQGPGPGMNMQMPMNGAFPPNKPPAGPHFGLPPPPHGHGPPFGGGPRMMGPPPVPQGRGVDNGNYWGEDSMRGGPHRGGHFHRGGRGRGAGGDQGFRGRGGRGGPRGGLNNMGGKISLCGSFGFVIGTLLFSSTVVDIYNVIYTFSLSLCLCRHVKPAGVSPFHDERRLQIRKQMCILPSRHKRPPATPSAQTLTFVD